MAVKRKRYAGPSFEEKRLASSGARFFARKHGLTASESAEVARAPQAIIRENERWAEQHGLAPSSAPARGRLLERVREDAARKADARRTESRGSRTERRVNVKRAARKRLTEQQRDVEALWPALGERRRARRKAPSARKSIESQLANLNRDEKTLIRELAEMGPDMVAMREGMALDAARNTYRSLQSALRGIRIRRRGLKAGIGVSRKVAARKTPRKKVARKVIPSGSVSRWEAKTLAAVDQGDLLTPAERDRLPRLEARGLLDERSGRLTAKGRRALAPWQEDPDIALLKGVRKGGR